MNQIWRAPEAPARNVEATTLEARAYRVPPTAQGEAPPARPKGRIPVTLENGVVLVGSDAHWWPNQYAAGVAAFIHFARKLQPDVIIMNGDLFDGSGISRFGGLTFAEVRHAPSVADQLDAVRANLHDIVLAAPNARRIWTLGNHDQRYEKRLLDNAPEFEGVAGFSLRDHFAAWEPAWSVEINDNVMVKHRFRGGIHAPYNNAIKGGRTIITGHLHSLQVRPISDYNGTRWGVDCGMLSDPRLPQYEYTEDNATDWRTGFVILTFREGALLWPEIVHVRPDGLVDFRGDLINLAGWGVAGLGGVR